MRMSWPILFGWGRRVTCHMFKSPWDCTKAEGRCEWATLCAFVGCSEVSCRHRVPVGSLLLCLTILGSRGARLSQFHLQSCSGPCALGWFFCPSCTVFRSISLPIMASLHLSPSSPISLSDYPLSYQFPFLPPPPRFDPYTPSWCFHHERMNPQVPHPILFKGKGSQGVGDIDPLKLYDRCWAH